MDSSGNSSDEFTGNPSLMAQECDFLMDWTLRGTNPQGYRAGFLEEKDTSGEPLVFIEGVTSDGARVWPEKEFGTFLRRVKVSRFRGMRVCLRMELKTEGVANWASTWMRVDGGGLDTLSFDNMRDRSLKGDLDWKVYRIVLDVPLGSEVLSFGLMMSGSGRLSARNIQLGVAQAGARATKASRPGSITEKSSLDVLVQELQEFKTFRKSWYVSDTQVYNSSTIASLSVPASELGGDFFFNRQLGSGQVLVFLGDVAGHTLSASLVAAHFRGVLECWSVQNPSAPEPLFAVMNRIVREFRAKPRPLTCTACLLLNPATGEWEGCLNGTPIPRLVDHEGNIRPLDMSPGMPIGALRAPRVRFTKGRLMPGDSILLFTDGLGEAWPDSPTQGDAEIDAILASHVHKGLPQQLQILMDLSARAMMETAYEDDRTAILVRFNGP
jgi:hypothetical protein